MNRTFRSSLPQTRAQAVESTGRMLIPAGLDRLGYDLKVVGSGEIVELPDSAVDISASHVESLQSAYIQNLDWFTGDGTSLSWGGTLDDVWNEVELLSEDELEISAPTGLKYISSQIGAIAKLANFSPTAGISIRLVTPGSVAQEPHMDQLDHGASFALVRRLIASYSPSVGTVFYAANLDEGKVDSKGGWFIASRNDQLAFAGMRFVDAEVVYRVPKAKIVLRDPARATIHSAPTDRTWLVQVVVTELYPNRKGFARAVSRYPDLTIPMNVRNRWGRHL